MNVGPVRESTCCGRHSGAMLQGATAEEPGGKLGRAPAEGGGGGVLGGRLS